MSEIIFPKQKLGFGLMRLPHNDDGSVDLPQVEKMADMFIGAGGTYFDTAYVYDGGRSEEAFRITVAERYPRNAYTIATKLNAAMQCDSEETAKRQFYTSLERTGAEYFDFYLLHALQRNNYRKYDDYHLWDFVTDLKRQGLVKHYGFSFHADPELLAQLLREHPDAEFVQLQINYADWDNPGVASRRNWEICRKNGKPVTIMEPVKGGVLADPVPAVKAVFDQSGSALSYPSWAIRWCASLEGIISVLSGMSTLAQMEDNLGFMRDFTPLSEEEMNVVEKAQAAWESDKSIQCTGCRYCADGCPMSIPIPDIFTVYNRKTGSVEFRTRREYTIVTTDKGKASECIKCGQCEDACPQHLPIIELLEKCREFE